jgi:hypothetical protein
MSQSQTLRLGAFAFCIAGFAASVTAQVTPIGPFTGTRQEGFQNIGLWPPAGPCTFCPSIPDAFGGIATLAHPTGAANIHITGGWGFVCSIGANLTPRLAASTGGAFDYVFNPGAGAYKFGGYFGTNAGVAGGTIEFYDASNTMIGSDILTHQADCQWVWHGWEFSVAVERIRVIGNYSGGGYVMMDDMEYDDTPTNPNAIGACCFPNGTCDFITVANCQAGGGSFRGENVTCATANCPQPGACCLGDGTCTFVLETACGTAGGTWAGAGVTCATANCPQPGACCFFDGTCSMLIPVECAAQGGTSLSGTCATASCPGYEFVENLPGVFTDISITGTFITNGDDSSVPFFSSVVNEIAPDPNLFASTNGVISSRQFTSWSNVQLPAATAGRAFFPFWDDLFADPAQGGAIYHQAAVEGGINIHIIQFNELRTYAGGAGSSTGTFQVKIFESGPILAQYIYQNVDFLGTPGGNGLSATVGYQAAGTIGNELQYSYNNPIILSGMVLSLVPVGGGGVCYANCDGSTVAPILNVDDFTCFINEFASAQSLPHAQQVTAYANCDGSTTAPALNVDDFTCFINQYATGCP